MQPLQALPGKPCGPAALHCVPMSRLRLRPGNLLLLSRLHLPLSLPSPPPCPGSGQGQVLLLGPDSALRLPVGFVPTWAFGTRWAEEQAESGQDTVILGFLPSCLGPEATPYSAGSACPSEPRILLISAPHSLLLILPLALRLH